MPRSGILVSVMRSISLPILVASVGLASIAASGCSGDDEETGVELTMTFANISTPGALVTTGGSAVDVMFAPGVWAVYASTPDLYPQGQAASSEIEMLSEDGKAQPLLRKVRGDGVAEEAGGLGGVTEGETYEENPIAPGGMVTYSFTARKGDRLAFASMFIQSNDIFVGAPAEGIALFDDAGAPIGGDVTSMVIYWDAGTEQNEEPGVGPNQAPRQGESDTGPDEGGVVSPLSGDTDSAGYNYPPLTSVLRVSIDS